MEESIPYHQCKTGSFSNTVFNVPPVTSSTTSFVKLSVVTPEPVFEDAAENSVSKVSVVYVIQLFIHLVVLSSKNL